MYDLNIALQHYSTTSIALLLRESDNYLDDRRNDPPKDGARLPELVGQVCQGVGGPDSVVGRLGADVGHGAGARKEAGEERDGRRRPERLEDVVAGEASVHRVDYLESAERL